MQGTDALTPSSFGGACASELVYRSTAKGKRHPAKGKGWDWSLWRTYHSGTYFLVFFLSFVWAPNTVCAGCGWRGVRAAQKPYLRLVTRWKGGTTYPWYLAAGDGREGRTEGGQAKAKARDQEGHRMAIDGMVRVSGMPWLAVCTDGGI